MSRNDASERRRVRASLRIATLVALPLAGVAAWATLRRESTDPVKLLRQADDCSATDSDKARLLLERAIELSGGTFPEAQVVLCRLLANHNDWDAVRSQFETLDRGAAPSRVLREFAEFALARGQPDLAVDALTEVRRRKDQETIPALELLFAEFRRRNDDRQMLSCVRELADLDQGRPEWWWKLLELLDARQLDLEYMSTLREALQRELPARDLAELRHRLTARLVEQGDAPQARRELQRIVEYEGVSRRSRLHQAAIERLEGDPAAALKTVETALAGATETAGALRLRALIEFDLGQIREAARDFEKEIERDPFDLTAQFKLSEAYRRLGEDQLANQHEALSREIREKRQQINKLRVAANRNGPDRRLCLRLAELNRDLNNSQAAAFWEERAREIGEHDKRNSAAPTSVPRP